MAARSTRPSFPGRFGVSAGASAASPPVAQAGQNLSAGAELAINIGAAARVVVLVEQVGDVERGFRPLQRGVQLREVIADGGIDDGVAGRADGVGVVGEARAHDAYAAADRKP